MGNRITIVDVARHAGVSQGTVGRVLHGTKGSKISEATSERVRKIAQQLSYQPNYAARQLAGKRSKNIGVLIDSNPTEGNYFRLAKIEARLRELDYHMIIGHETNDVKLVNEYLNDFMSRSIEGLICVHHYYPQDPKRVAQLVTSAVRNVVFIDRPAIDNATSVGPDLEDGSRQVVRYLLDKGCERIGFTIPDLDWYSGPRLKQGYVEELQAHGREVDDKLVWVGTKRVGSGAATHITHEIADKIIDNLVVSERADAIVANSDLWAARLVNCLCRRDYRVPQDISVVGFDNFHLGEYVRPALTSVDPNYHQVAYTAVDMLADMLKHETYRSMHRNLLIKPKMVIRESA